MIDIIKDLPDDILGLTAAGKITVSDYEDVLIPETEKRLKDHDKLKFLMIIESFDGWELEAMWEDAKYGFGHWNEIDDVAIVTDIDWIRHVVPMFKWLFPGDVKLFSQSEAEKARNWLVTGTLPA